MSGSDTGIAGFEAKRDDAPPVAVACVERVTRKFHRLRFKVGKQLAEVSRLLRKIAIDMAERSGHFVHDRDAILDQTERHTGLQQDKTGTDFLHERAGRFRQDEIVGHEDVAELHAVGAGAVHGEKRFARLQRDRGVGTIGEKHHDLAGPIFDLKNRAEEMIRTEIRHPGQRAAHHVATVDPAALQFQLLNSEEGLHRIGKTGAAENFSGRDAVGESGNQRRIG